MSAHTTRISARDIAVSPDDLAHELVEIGCSGSPDRDPPCMVALALARCRARIDRARWAAEESRASHPAGWRPPPTLRLVKVSGKDRATGDFE